MTRQESVQTNQKTYQGKPCKYGHSGVRRTDTRTCVVCQNDKNLKYYRNNRESGLAHRRLYNQTHRNVEEAKEYNKNYRQSPRGRAAYNAKAAKRRAMTLQRTAAWADLNKIKHLYAEAIRVSEETGIKMHVDHIFPLQGRTVSGLHVSENLRIIPAKENLSKSNSLQVS